MLFERQIQPFERHLEQPHPLNDRLATHATILQSAGYSTGYVGKWHMGQAVRPGFDWFASFTGQGLTSTRTSW